MALLPAVLLLITGGATGHEYHLDEGWELMKAWMVMHGHVMYGEFWNDQPPLHTHLLAALMGIFGAEPFTGRALALGFAAALLAVFFDLVLHRHGTGTAWLALALFAVFPHVAFQFVAVMLGLPAYALGMLSLWCWLRFLESGRLGWMALAGLALGLGLQTKLTAILVVPAIVAQTAIACQRRAAVEEWTKTFRAGCRAIGGFTGAAALGWMAMAMLIPGVSLVELIRLHTDAPLRNAFADPARYGGLNSLLSAQWPLLIFALAGTTTLIHARRWEHLLPVWLLAGAYAAHAWQRPFWPHYAPHLALPLAWLAAAGLMTSFQSVSALKRPRLPVTPGMLAANVVLAGLCGLLATRVWANAITAWDRLHPADRADDLAAVGWLRESAAPDQLVYTDRPLLAFLAQRHLPPELVVVPKKRLLARRLTPEDLVGVLSQRQPVALLLSPTAPGGPVLGAFLSRSYLRTVRFGNLDGWEILGADSSPATNSPP